MYDYFQNSTPFYGHPNTTMMSNQASYLQGHNLVSNYNNLSFNAANQGYQQWPNDSLINFGHGLTHSVQSYSPGGVSGFGAYAEPYAQQQMPVWDQQISGYQDTFQQVTNTHHYQPDAFNQYFDYWDNRASSLGISSPTSGNLAYSLNSAASETSNLMNQPSQSFSNWGGDYGFVDQGGLVYGTPINSYGGMVI